MKNAINECLCIKCEEGTNAEDFVGEIEKNEINENLLKTFVFGCVLSHAICAHIFKRKCPTICVQIFLKDCANNIKHAPYYVYVVS